MPSCFFTSCHCAASLFRLASVFLSSLTFCLQGTLSLVVLASTIDELLSQCWMWCFCVDLIFGETGSSLLLTKFAELSAKKCICCWPCHFALLKQHSFCFWALLPWFTRCSLRRIAYFNAFSFLCLLDEFSLYKKTTWCPDAEPFLTQSYIANPGQTSVSFACSDMVRV